MKVFLLVVLLYLLGSNLVQAEDPPRYEFPSYQPVVPTHTLPDPFSKTGQRFDTRQCRSGYILRGGQLGKDIYFVLDCLDDESLESQN